MSGCVPEVSHLHKHVQTCPFKVGLHDYDKNHNFEYSFEIIIAIVNYNNHNLHWMRFWIALAFGSSLNKKSKNMHGIIILY